jgi:hypothetical protein
MEEFFAWLKKEKGISKITLEEALEIYYDEWKESRRINHNLRIVNGECENCKKLLNL